jgi:hypothetical protein
MNPACPATTARFGAFFPVTKNAIATPPTPD